MLNDAYDKVEKQKKGEERERRKRDAERERERREDAAQLPAASKAIINEKETEATEDAIRLKLTQLISSYMQQLDPSISLERVTLRDLKQAVMPHFENWVPLFFLVGCCLCFLFFPGPQSALP